MKTPFDYINETFSLMQARINFFETEARFLFSEEEKTKISDFSKQMRELQEKFVTVEISWKRMEEVLETKIEEMKNAKEP